MQSMPTTLSALKENFPKAMDYLLAKNPTGIKIEGNYVMLFKEELGVKSYMGHYDWKDLELFNELKPAE